MTEEYLGLQIDLSRDSLFDSAGLVKLKDGYMIEGETSPQHRFAFIAKQFGTNRLHSQRLYEYASKHWLSFSTPILSFGKNKRGLPISCFLSWMEDTSAGLVDTLAETQWLSMLGGGVGIGFGIRSADDKSTGIMAHMKVYDASSLAYRQGKTRRGSYAAYLDISHPDIIQFLEMRKVTGDQNLRAMNMNHGICIPDSFMKQVENCMLDDEADDRWPLVDPHTKEIKSVISVKELWQKIIETRMQTGEPYILFIDTANNDIPEWLKKKGYTIRQSNLCSEVLLHTDEKKTAVCCLSSLNLEYYDDWCKNKDFIFDVAEMLDNVLQYFIDNAPKTISRAILSAKEERSIGIGELGFHALLQKRGFAWESPMTVGLNKKVFKHIRTMIDEANIQLGTTRGIAPMAWGTGKRFCMTSAIAPNASTSIILGNTSPSIEPFRANAYRQDTLQGSFMNKNKFLDKIIKEICEKDKSQDYDEIWSSIISNDGSVQHLSVLTEQQKEVFKTAMELDQRWLVQLAADRQEYIDQGQSLNLFFRPDVNVKYIHAVHFMAWKLGLKTLYYCRSEKIGKADKIARKIERNVIEEIDLKAIVEDGECLACQ